MKKRNIFLFFFVSVLLSFFWMLGNTVQSNAKVEVTEDFTVSIGQDDVIWPQLVLSDNGSDYVLNFLVTIKGNKQEAGPVFSWTNTMSYFVDGVEIEEKDTMHEEGVTLGFDVNGEYSFNIFDEHMPTYILGGEKPIDKVYFHTKLECLNCGVGQAYENYSYPIQTTEVFELEVKYDYTKPSFCKDESECSYPSANSYINDVPFKIMITDDESGIDTNSLRYAFLTIENPSLDDLTEKLVLGEDFYYKPERKDLINSEQVYQSVWLYVFALDNAGNYIFISTYSYRYNFEKIDNNLEYDKDLSVIPSVDEFYKSINIKIVSNQELYYIWTEYYEPFAYASEVKKDGTLYDKDIGIEFSTNGSGEANLIVVSFENEEEFSFMILRYQFDNTAPSIAASTFPELEKTYKTVTLNFTFTDAYGKVDKSYYLLSDAQNENIEDINNEYQGGNLILGDSLNGNYYVHLIVYDTVGNYRYYVLPYIFDNSAPILTLSVNETDALYPNQKNITMSVNELKGTTFKCKWALSSATLTKNDLDVTCTNGGKIDVPKNAEGYYKLWAYLEDNVGNDVLYSSYDFLVDSKGPSISFDTLFIDEIYRENNDIDVIALDSYTGVSSLNYNWFPYNQNITNGSLFSLNVNDGINYPENVYGIYALWVYAIDGAGNSSLVKDNTRYYIDTERYSLSLKGNETINIVKNQKFIDPGVNALKGERKMNYEVVSDLNVKKVGTYIITYKFQGLEVTRKVVVSQTTQYYLTIGISVLIGLVLSFIPFKKKKIV